MKKFRCTNSNAKIKSENLTAKEDKQAVYSAEYKFYIDEPLDEEDGDLQEDDGDVYVPPSYKSVLMTMKKTPVEPKIPMNVKSMTRLKSVDKDDRKVVMDSKLPTPQKITIQPAGDLRAVKHNEKKTRLTLSTKPV